MKIRYLNHGQEQRFLIWVLVGVFEVTDIFQKLQILKLIPIPFELIRNLSVTKKQRKSSRLSTSLIT